MKFGLTSPERVASIDIGTNTILLLIAEVDRGRLDSLLDTETIVRLGEGVQHTGILSDEAMERGLKTLGAYLTRCDEMGVQKIFAIGTSALREAQNSSFFLQKVKEQFDLSIEVISGEEEARYSFLSVAKDLKEGKTPLLVVDVGGGSTEFILGHGTHVNQSVSLPLGSVRLTEKYLLSDPVCDEEWEEMNRAVQQMLFQIPHPPPPFRMVAVGGTATTLASVEMELSEFFPEKIHHFELKREALKRQLSLYRSTTLEQRRRIPGLASARADVILAGGTILYQTMEELECRSVSIHCHGIRYGLLYHKLNLEQPIFSEPK